MGVIVGSNYLYIECNKPGCYNQTCKVYGDGGQEHHREVDKVARQSGWRVSFTSSDCTCPECWQKEQQLFLGGAK